MYGEVTKYYLLRDNINKIPKLLDDILSYDDSLLFNVAGFTSLATFYRLFNPFKRDHYNIYYKLANRSTFKRLLAECILDTKKKDSPERLIMCYGLIAADTVDYYLKPYLEQIKDPKETLEGAYNMVDYYLANKRDNIDLSKECIGKIVPDAFSYYAYMEDLIHSPYVKLLHLFETEVFYKKCLKRKRFYYFHLTKNTWYLKALYKSYDFITLKRKKPRAIDFMYKNNLDTKILNLDKNDYILEDGNHNESLDELLLIISNEIKRKLIAINDYLLYKKDKLLMQELGIDIDMIK